MENIFEGADIIHTYSRAQAIEDGTLVELDPALCREAGLKFPVAVTQAVFAECIGLTPAAVRACNDIKGRTWDVLTMLKDGIRRARSTTTIEFQAYVVRARVRPTLTSFKAVCGPGDAGEPVITIMFPTES